MRNVMKVNTEVRFYARPLTRMVNIAEASATPGYLFDASDGNDPAVYYTINCLIFIYGCSGE